MARPLYEHGPNYHFLRLGFSPLAIALFVCVSFLVALCAKNSRRAPQKPDSITNGNTGNVSEFPTTPTHRLSPLALPRKFVSSISNKAIDPFKKRSREDHESELIGQEMENNEGFGEGGLWQKSILMGDKCRPHEFSGVIYYDNHGKQISEMPRSPGASSVPSFSFPVLQDSNYKY